MSDDADRAAELQERANQAAIRARRLPSHLRGNPRCGCCGGPNDRPEYARCSDCVYVDNAARPEPDTITCGSCAHFAPGECNSGSIGTCAKGIQHARTPRGLQALRPLIHHGCLSWAAATPKA